MKPVFFESPEELRAWFEENHESPGELWVGYWKKASGKSGITHEQAVEQALCFGWIDGLARSIDEDRWQVRFTPRRPGSNWSDINIARAERLGAAGLMRPAGIEAFEARTAEPREREELSPELERRLRADGAAHEHWLARPPGYRRLAGEWVMSAKREETRERRLAQLIECSAAGREIPPLAEPLAEPRRDPSK